MPSRTASHKIYSRQFGPGDLGPTVVSERTIMDNPGNSLKSDIDEDSIGTQGSMTARSS